MRCVAGRLYDVVVDIRIGSAPFGQWLGVKLSAENGPQLLEPEGFLHGFVTREPDTEIFYKCSDYYAPECEGAIRFDAPDLAIDWQVPAAEAIVSEKDAAAGLLRDLDSPFQFED